MLHRRSLGDSWGHQEHQPALQCPAPQEVSGWQLGTPRTPTSLTVSCSTGGLWMMAGDRDTKNTNQPYSVLLHRRSLDDGWRHQEHQPALQCPAPQEVSGWWLGTPRTPTSLTESCSTGGLWVMAGDTKNTNQPYSVLLHRRSLGDGWGHQEHQPALQSPAPQEVSGWWLETPRTPTSLTVSCSTGGLWVMAGDRDTKNTNQPYSVLLHRRSLGDGWGHQEHQPALQCPAPQEVSRWWLGTPRTPTSLTESCSTGGLWMMAGDTKNTNQPYSVLLHRRSLGDGWGHQEHQPALQCPAPQEVSGWQLGTPRTPTSLTVSCSTGGLWMMAGDTKNTNQPYSVLLHRRSLGDGWGHQEHQPALQCPAPQEVSGWWLEIGTPRTPTSLTVSCSTGGLWMMAGDTKNTNQPYSVLLHRRSLGDGWGHQEHQPALQCPAPQEVSGWQLGTPRTPTSLTVSCSTGGWGRSGGLIWIDLIGLLLFCCCCCFLFLFLLFFFWGEGGWGGGGVFRG